MPLAKPLPPLEELLRAFLLDAESGRLYWRKRPDMPPQWNGKWAGREAGTPGASHGRLVVCLQSRLLLAHRVVWKLHHGTEPPDDIDHIDGDFTNNRPQNMRAASKHENLRNSRLHRGKTLPKGVSFHRGAGRYRATIYIGGRHRHLGLFNNPSDAHAAYRTAAIQAFGEFARFG